MGLVCYLPPVVALVLIPSGSVLVPTRSVFERDVAAVLAVMAIVFVPSRIF